MTEDNFISLQFQDYDSVGITEHTERQKLFKLIQVVKRELENATSTESNNNSSSNSVPVKTQKRAVRSSRSSSKSSSDSSSSGARRSTKSNSKPSGSTGDDRETKSNKKVSKIRVCVRKRPRNRKEKERGEADVIEATSGEALIVHETKQKVDLTKYVESHEFVFDEVFDKSMSNREIYEVTCKPMVSFFMNKGKATCFAYGQTGSGKTYTMMGPGGGKQGQTGLYVLAAHDIFNMVKKPKYNHLQVMVSFFEIYGGKMFDLLNGREKLVCREDGQKNVNIVGLSEKKCTNVDQLLELIIHGNSVRSTGSTGANIDSSRSHAILQIAVKKEVHSKTPLNNNTRLVTHGKFSFIDLAGSERAADTTNNNRRTRLEGAEINKSLLALKECIRALDQDKVTRMYAYTASLALLL